MSEYPVHNYGTNPLGQFGMQLILKNLDWDEKRKILEEQARSEVLRSNREEVSKLSTTGSLLPGSEQELLKYGYTPAVIQGMMNQSNQKRNQLTSEKQSKDIQDAANSAKIGESIGKSISEIFKTGREFGESQQKQINNLSELSAKGIVPESEVQKFKENSFNSIIAILDKAGLSKAYGPLIQDGVMNGRIKESYETMTRMEIAKNSSIINDSKSTKEEIAAAFGKNKALIVSSGMKPEEMKVLIGGDNEAMQAALKEKLAPPQPTKVPVGTKQDIQRGSQNVGQRLTKYDEQGNPVFEDIPGAAGPKFAPHIPDEMAKIGNIRAVGLNLASEFFPLAKQNMGPDADKLSEGLFMTDQFGQTVNEARLRNYLTPEQRGAYKWIKIEAERLATNNTPAKAVDLAIKSYNEKFPTNKIDKQPPDTERESAMAAIAAGKDPVQVKAMYEKRTGKKY